MIVRDYKKRNAPVPRGRPKRFILERDDKSDHKKEAAEDFISWIEEQYGEQMVARIRRTKGNIPYGAFKAYALSHTRLRRRCAFKPDGHMDSKDRGYMRLLRLYMRAVKLYIAEGPVVAARETAVAECSETAVAVCSEAAVAVCSETAVAVCSDDPNRKHINKRQRPLQYEDTRRKLVQDWQRRRRVGGQGAPRRAVRVREGLFMWYNIIRHSVDMKIMCRFPKLAFKVKANQLYQEYLLCCLNLGENPEHVNINDRWINDWLRENRLTDRKPNRKWKVSRPVLAERLKIFWITIYKLRKLFLLARGYDPHMRNLDQSPFHMNEAGSQVVGTIAMKGAPIIPVSYTHLRAHET